MDHRTASDPFQYAGQLALPFARHFSGGVHDGARAEAQPMHGAQIPLDGAEGQPGLLPKRGNQAHYIDPQTLPPQRHAVQLRRWHTAASAAWAGAGDVSVLGNLHRNLGQVNDFPSALGPAAGQLSSAVGALFQRVLHPLGRRHAGAGKAVGTALAWPFGLGRFPVGFGLQTGHPTRAAWLGRPLELANPFLQPLDDRLLPDDDGLLPDNAGNQGIAVGSLEVNFRIHTHYMTQPPPAAQDSQNPYRPIHLTNSEQLPSDAQFDLAGRWVQVGLHSSCGLGLAVG